MTPVNRSTEYVVVPSVNVATLLPLNVNAPVKVNAPLGEFPVIVAVPEPEVIIQCVVAVALVMTRLLITTLIPIVPFLVESGFTVKLPVLFNWPVMEYTRDVGEKPAIVSTELPPLTDDKLGPLKLPLKVRVLVTLSATLFELQLSLLLILYL